MRKPIALLMAAILLLPFVCVCRTGVEARCLSAFEREDFSRREAISSAVGSAKSMKNEALSKRETGSAGDRYIVRFSGSLSEEEVCFYLKNKEYRLLSDSAERVFSVCLDDPDTFANEVGSGLLYCSPDRTLEVCALPDDPLLAEQPEYEFLHLSEVWSTVTAKKNVTVAVLDTGIDRTHEDLSGTEILSGFDVIDNHAGVQKDSTGHGTAVTGLIAATAGNGLGTAGVAYGVRILPVRIAAGAVNIYSSDLVNGLRFAADAGADIINLSFGGYTFSAAENDAVRYALSKGCILIASAGNGGQTERGNEPCYPAAYDGVISVGSCGLNGERSAFSQRSVAVDLLVPGENILLLAFDGEHKSTYRRDNGTSYSAALFSGLTALLLSALDKDVRFEGPEAEALVAGLGEWRWMDGYGAADPLGLLAGVNAPIITGVKNGDVHIGKVAIGFNRGKATLDGEEFSDGETVYQTGSHVLIVKDGSEQKKITFRVSYTPAKYEIRKNGAIASVIYSGGSALLDGIPYKSGTAISAYGFHTFVLTDEFGETKEERFFFDPSAPVVLGVENGKTYKTPLHIRVTEEGKVFLDGKQTGHELVVDADGKHTLRVENEKTTETITFTLSTGSRTEKNDLSRCGVIVDELHGWYAVYGELLAGIRVYELSTGKYLGFFETGSVESYVLTETELLIFGDWQYNYFDPATVPDTVTEHTSFTVRCNGFAYLDGTTYCLAEGSLCLIDPDARTAEPIRDTAADELYCDGEALWLYDTGTGVFEKLDAGYQTVLSVSVPSSYAERRMLADGFLFCGKNAYDAETGELRFSFEGYALTEKDGLLYSTEGVYSLKTGLQVGKYAEPVSGVTFSGDRVYLCGYAGGIRICKEGTEYAPLTKPIPTEAGQTDTFSTSYRMPGKPGLLIGDGAMLILCFAGDRGFVRWYEDTGFSYTALPFLPIGAAMSDYSSCLWSETLVWKDGTLFRPDGRIKTCFYRSGVLYVLTDRLLAFRNGELTDTGIQADTANGNGDLLAYAGNGVITVSKGNVISSVSGKPKTLLTDGNYLIADRNVYRMDGHLTLVGSLPSVPSALCDGMALTSDGLYALAGIQKKTAVSHSAGTLAVMTEKIGLVIWENGTLTRSSFGRDLRSVYTAWSDPVLIGCDDHALYDVSTEIRYDRGLCHLDGNLCPSGTVVTGAGAHILTLYLPCGRLLTRRFSVIPALESIAFATTRYHLTVGESEMLYLLFRPQETNAVPVSFRVSGNCVELTEDGRFTAVSEGVALITATTEDGRFNAYCQIVVDADLIRFDPESGYRIDRVAGTLSGVDEGTTAEMLMKQLLNTGNVRISDEILKTGSKITLYGNGGEISEELTVAVTGDLDGDGLVTVGDLYFLQTMMLAGEEPEGITALAADLNGSGNITDRDLHELLEWVVFIGGNVSRRLPAQSTGDKATLFVATPALDGDTVAVTVLLSACPDVYAVSGRIKFDPEKYTFAGYETYGSELQYFDRSTQTSFVLSGKQPNKAMPIVTFYYKVNETEEVISPEFLLRDVVLLGDELRSVERMSLVPETGRRTFGDIELLLEGADVPFDPDVHGYEVYLPYGTPGLIYSLVYPENCTVETENLLFLDADELNATFRFRMPDGKTEVYTVHALRNTVPPKSGDCSLASLTVKGAEFVFDPETTEYHIRVPYETDRLELQWETNDENASVRIGPTGLTAGKETVVLVTVTAEDGTIRIYRLFVFREEAGGEASDGSEEPGGARGAWIVLPCVAAAAAAGSAAFIRKKRKTEPDPETETKSERNDTDGTERTDDPGDPTENA